ncbi:MAG: PorV/PorQ family protein [Candidatus Hydrogenedentota bacterium]
MIERLKDSKIQRFKDLKIQSFLVSYFLLLASLSYATNDAGRNSALFLNINPSARTAALGSSGVAEAGDIATALFLNPAGLERNTRHNVYFMHHALFEDIYQDFLSYSVPLGQGIFGTGITWIDYGDIQRTTLANPYGGIGTFSGNDFLFTLSYGVRPLPYWIFGGSLKFLREKLETQSSGGAALDFGVIWNTPVEGFDLGMSIRNVGSSLKYDVEDEDLPITIQAGCAIHLFEERLNLFIDVKKIINDDEIGLNIGGEFWGLQPLSIRCGYDSNRDATKAFSVGFGIRYSDFTLDYAFIPKDDLESTHRIGASVSFGKPRERKVVTRSREALLEQLKKSAEKEVGVKKEEKIPKPPVRDKEYPVKLTPPETIPRPSVKPIKPVKVIRDLEEYLQEGELAFLRGEVTKAIEYFSEAASFYPSSFRAFYNLGTCYYTIKEYSKAKESYISAINLQPRNSDVHLYLGFTYLKLYDIQNAIKEWQVVLEIDPSNEIARNNIEALSEY